MLLLNLHTKRVGEDVSTTGLHLPRRPSKLRQKPDLPRPDVPFDDKLTFRKHVQALKEKMARRRQCLQVITGKSYGAQQGTLRLAYLAYIRSVFGNGAAFHLTHTALAIRSKLEAEHNKCTCLITGCIRPTKIRALLAEARLPALTVGAKELAVTELETSETATRQRLNATDAGENHHLAPQLPHLQALAPPACKRM